MKTTYPHAQGCPSLNGELVTCESLLVRPLIGPGVAPAQGVCSVQRECSSQNLSEHWPFAGVEVLEDGSARVPAHMSVVGTQSSTCAGCIRLL